MLPVSIDEVGTAEVLDKATDEVTRNGWFHGSPQEMADQIAPFIEAGVNWVQIADMLPITRPPEEGAECLGRSIELARLVKQLSSVPDSRGLGPELVVREPAGSSTTETAATA